MPRLLPRPGLVAIVFALLFMGLALNIRADSPEVLFRRNGENVAGRAVGFEDGALKWQTVGGQILTVPIGDIDRIEYHRDTAQPARHGPVVTATNPEHPPSAGGPDLAAPEKVGAVADAEPPRSYFELVYSSLESTYARAFTGVSDWTERIELGARFQDGNTDSDFLNVAAEFEQKTESRMVQIEGGGQYGQANGDLNTNRWFANATVDFNRDGNWILFVTSKNEYDEFENLDYRGTLSGGLGYRFFNEEGRRLIFRLGPGVTHEDFDSPDMTRTTPDLFGEMELKWPLDERIGLEHKTTVNPSVEDFSVVRVVSNNGLLFQLDEDDKWSLKLGFRYEYNSQPNAGRELSDYTSSILLVYTRK